MRIFVSYAGEQRAAADAIALRLRQGGHDVFFDKDDLPPAESFDDRIRQCLNRSHGLIFLVSPQSVAPGAYTLTELALARERWKNPSGRVLPVMIAPTPYADIPEYLKAVTVLEPKGNVVGETVAAVEPLARKRRRRRLAVLGLALALIVSVGATSWRRWWPHEASSGSPNSEHLKVLRFATVSGDCPATLAGMGVTVVVEGRSLDKSLDANCTVALAVGGTAQRAVTLRLSSQADFALDNAASPVLLNEDPVRITVIPTRVTPRVQLAVLPFAGVSPSDPNRLSAESAFRGMLAAKLENLAQELLGRPELQASELARSQLTKLKLTSLEEPRSTDLDLEQKLSLWRQLHSLGLLTGTLTQSPLPAGSPYEVRTQIFIGDLDGSVQGRSFPLVMRLRPEEFGETGDVHALAVLYALALDARRLGGPNQVITAYLSRAYSISQSIKDSGGAGSAAGKAGEVTHRLDEALNHLAAGG